ncbi:hypothetical protein [Mycetocola spongiae]|uniref:hypothetical protein n=1 Tax=Mycetocola spongiae TaxID=2859226 RepID=UPI001CF1C1C5|nr:hypothetical protein [Mycetocola spongiae]UCR89259.1 hypothetical protein KXZ72_00655 [Mycetocola spongiae]
MAFEETTADELLKIAHRVMALNVGALRTNAELGERLARGDFSASVMDVMAANGAVSNMGREIGALIVALLQHFGDEKALAELPPFPQGD